MEIAALISSLLDAGPEAIERFRAFADEHPGASPLSPEVLGLMKSVCQFAEVAVLIHP
jgi:hypothetical protein